MRGAPATGTVRRFLVPGALLTLLVVVGLVLRIAPMSQEFWFDELLSLRIAFTAPGAANIFFPPRFVDTPLNQIVWRVIGPAAPEWCYRLPSLLAGTAALFLLYLVSRGTGRRVSRMTLLLGTFSYMMVHYCSEARAFAPVMFLALAAFLSLEKIHEEGTGGSAPLFLFWISSALGFLSHPIFILFYAGALAYSIAGELLPADGTMSRRSALLKVHAPVAVFLCAYLAWYLGQTPGDPIPYAPGRVALDFLDFSFGTPGWVPAPWKAIPPVLLSAVVSLGVVREWKEGRRERCIFLGSSTVVAFIVFVLGTPAAFRPRYLIVLLPFVLLVVARGIVALWDRGWAGRIAAAAFLALFLTGNGYHLYRFLEDGRGHYRSALLEMATRTEGETIAVGADNDERLEMLLWYGEQEMTRSTGKKFRFVGQEEFLQGVDPDWIILQSDETGAEFPAAVRKKGRASHLYRRVAVYPHYGLSGFSWGLYRR